MGHGVGVFHLALHPGAGGIAKNRTTHGKAFDQRLLGSQFKRGRQFILWRVQTQNHDPACVGVVPLDCFNSVGPGRVGFEGLQLPPVGIDARVIELLDQGRGGVVIDRRNF